MIKSQLIYAHLVINQGSHNHISQKNFCPSKEITQSGEGNSNAINVIKDDQCENFLFLQKKKMDLPEFREYIVQKSSLNVFGVIKVFTKKNFCHTSEITYWGEVI